jgi:DNA-binding GntR family transcriptional regulator
VNQSQSSLTDIVQRELERRILKGILGPGEHVTEQAVAEELGVSRGPIREACRALERAGLVEIIRNRGVFVREVDLQRAVDIFDIRAELTGIVAREAVQNVSPKSLANLDQLVGKMDEAAARGNVDTYLPLNLQFHAALYGLADNQRVAALDQELGNELLVYRRRGLASGGGLAVSNIEHRQILTALAGGNAAELKRLFQRHINGGKQRFLDAIGSEKTPS